MWTNTWRNIYTVIDLHWLYFSIFFSIINFYIALISYYQQKTLEKLKTFEKSEKLSLPIFYAIRVSGI